MDVSKENILSEKKSPIYSDIITADMRIVVGYIFIVLALFIIGFVMYKNSPYSQKVPTFSSYTLLSSSWEKYKSQFINTDGRVVDPSQGDITTSEGQSYALLRSVWIDDPSTFERIWQWTKNNLRRPNDYLFGWKWGKRADSTYGFITQGGENSASDADSDIALGLLLASSRWNNKKYEQAALPIIRDIWTVETSTTSAGKRYLAAGNWATTQNAIVVNPSYFSPYAWRIFAQVDKHDAWDGLIDPAYQLLRDSSQAQLDTGHAIGLPPDWILVDRKMATLHSPHITNLTTHYSYDAMRIPWRINIDYRWNNAPQAKTYLNSLCSALLSLYTEHGKLSAVYTHDGDVINDEESPALYGASSGCFDVIPNFYSELIYQQKIVSLYSNTLSDFNPRLSYYDQNWIWFGAALQNNMIINFFH